MSDFIQVAELGEAGEEAHWGEEGRGVEAF